MPPWLHDSHPRLAARMSEPTPLAKLRVLVTRPQQRAANFAGMVTRAGGKAVRYPVITITNTTNHTRRNQLLDRLDAYQMAIFISPTAVEATLALITRLPETITPVAIGSRTAHELQQQGYHAVVTADSHDSEGLLAHTSMQTEHVTGKNIIIFRGEGGRDLLADSLRGRGAMVDYADIYRRSLPDVVHLQTTDLKQLQAICITSNQGLEHLLLLCDDLAVLKTLPLFVPGQRAASLASQLGFSDIHRAENASDEAMLHALIHWAETR